MFSSRRRVLIAVLGATVALGAATVAVVQLTGDSPDEAPPPVRVVQPGAPGQPGRTLSPADRSQLPAPPAHTDADTRFMQHMIGHHTQALEMTALVADRAQSADVSLLARRIETSQGEEITQMQRWLTERGEEVPGPHTHHAGQDAEMPGMLTPEQFRQLERARDGEFDRLFLNLMIRHHEGALTMVRQLYATGGGLEPAADKFAREVEADQSIEVRSMRELQTRLAG
ncbi:DUF305 domain-containing protein [Micromonospora krabiensis]|uniref:Uncharacterized conserved protein, DUF305 family n=1 Tax=Micromonospora krabiensis TaxID=307121 RepID=A0A1C3N310_9ACTN|nr:DUF305 domain-containing protein [Micromonospora krabiensis]SBV26958.1 Uncharacterized conserved protein, DUF305 family [Micromonospora krabiensis]